MIQIASKARDGPWVASAVATPVAGSPSGSPDLARAGRTSTDTPSPPLGRGRPPAVSCADRPGYEARQGTSPDFRGATHRETISPCPGGPAPSESPAAPHEGRFPPLEEPTSLVGLAGIACRPRGVAKRVVYAMHEPGGERATWDRWSTCASCAGDGGCSSSARSWVLVSRSRRPRRHPRRARTRHPRASARERRSSRIHCRVRASRWPCSGTSCPC